MGVLGLRDAGDDAVRTRQDFSGAGNRLWPASSSARRVVMPDSRITAGAALMHAE